MPGYDPTALSLHSHNGQIAVPLEQSATQLRQLVVAEVPGNSTASSVPISSLFPLIITHRCCSDASPLKTPTRSSVNPLSLMSLVARCFHAVSSLHMLDNHLPLTGTVGRSYC
jgi:hypothetical protein